MHLLKRLRKEAAHLPMSKMLDKQTLAQWRLQVDCLLQGQRWCVSCGTVSITKEQPEYQIRCTNCWIEHKETKGKLAQSKYCKQCGTHIENSRKDYAMRMGTECRTCYMCKKGVREKTRGIYIPNHWEPYTDELFTSLPQQHD